MTEPQPGNPRRCRRRYQAILWLPDKRERSWSIAASRSFRSIESARRQCKRWMATKIQQTTRYLPIQRPPFADVRDVKRDIMIEEHDAPVEIVPSVGEVGYW